jgi:uncharacterized protein DUF1264
MSTYLNGLHMYADDMARQVEASHFCIHLRHDLHQCVIFDRNAPDARLIGIEYIISNERFRSLPEDEKGYGTATIARSNPAAWSPRASLIARTRILQRPRDGLPLRPATTSLTCPRQPPYLGRDVVSPGQGG